ncbi:endo-1,4-beta-xylanase [Pedobacter cryophilus]|uniref:Beta-xylanase n=1 Tax=Pedobacter cryophilus TaxID=2571271 RepID=A0A4U1BYZ8_9SPHI|nr:endo-1,4-beta-xylanase [Pedobacter cryophilus]TKB95727.1 1,4-beta-xylanase [Pedobacter cryophilus]
MKRFNNIALIGLVSSIAIISCKKYESLEYQVGKPLTIANQEQIDAYNPLKSYLDSVKYPKFKFGAAISLSEYVSKGVMYRLVNSNFNDITAGYEMKHGSVVRNDGTLNLTNVNNLLQTASKAKISVFGHALVWHSGQNATYLNKLIAPIIIPGVSQPTWDLETGANFETDAATNYEYNANAVASFTAAGQGAGGTGRALKITNTSVRTQDYDVQLFVKLPNAVVAGEKYELVMDVKADNAASYPTQAHVTPGAYKHWDFFGTISATTTWAKYTKQITVTADMATSKTIAFNLGKTATSFYFDNITVKKYNEKGSGNAGYSYFFTNPTAANYWTAQVVHSLSPLQNGKEYTIKFAAKGSVAGNIRSELQSTSDYSNNAFGTIALTTAWKEYEFKTTTTKADRNNFVISFGDYVGKVNIDNVKLTLTDGTANLIPTIDFESGVGAWGGYGNGSTRGLSAQGEGYGGAQDQIIEKTADQKKTLIANAMKSWISAMVDTTKKYVKAWDVVNEPMDDGRPYELKTGVGRVLPADEFFWQDYLGKDYAVDAFKLARQYGNASDVHFINDYNLEYSIDKCKGLIQYVQYIESKGAKVDGIGTQMHISIDADKAKIEEMFRLLAATGKLIKVSELDMGLVNKKKTPEATVEDLTKQMELYKFVIDKYFEIIPANQRYGITIWSPLDSPVSSFWRAGEPIGLWTEGFVRKPAFMGVSEALKGK